MEMYPIYDEDLLENKFLQQFREICPALFQKAVEDSWLICIPKCGSFESHTLTELDFMSHVLIPLGSNTYKTASDKNVVIKEKTVHLGEGFDTRQQITILFLETFYTDTSRKYQVLCVEKPLSFHVDHAGAFAKICTTEFQVQNIEDATAVLFQGKASDLKKQLEKMIQMHKTVLTLTDLNTSTLRHLIDTMHALFTKVMQVVQKDSQMKKRMQQDANVGSNLKISVEIYIHHSLYNLLFRYICTATAADDAKLNKITRNLSQVQLKDLCGRTEFGANIPRARKELPNLSKYSTPLAKMACIKRIISALMMSPRSNGLEPLTADDLLLLLIFLIIRSGIPNWFANFEYMMKFHFSKSAVSEYTFHLSTLEAALQYILSGGLDLIPSSTDNHINKEPDTPAQINSASSPAISLTIGSRSKPCTVDSLFELIKIGDYDSVAELLDQNGDDYESTKRLCHPLCSCDNCELLRDRTINTQSHVTVFSRDDRGYTALHQAALYGNAHLVEYLKKQGSVVNATDYHGSTPLHLASQRGHQSAVMMLIYHGADVNAADNDGNRPIHFAASNGHEETIKALLFQSESSQLLDVNAANENGDTALHLAAKWSYETIIRILLEHGASPEARNRHKCTPMMLVSDGRIANMLTEAIEKSQEQTNAGFIEVSPSTSPSVMGLSSDTMATMQPFLAFNQPRREVSTVIKKFLKAVADCDVEMVKHHLAKYDRADSVGEVPSELCHPLCQCSRCAPAQKASLLRLDLNSGDEQGRTALHVATEKGCEDIVRLLLQQRVDVNARTDHIQSTALHVACQQLVPSEQIVKLLIQNDAKVNCKDCNGRTPLHFSSQTGAVGITQLLLQAGANTAAANIRGNTPLHEAAKVNNVDIVRMLLDHNANPALGNRDGLTALQLTSDRHIIALLTSAVEKTKYLDCQTCLPPQNLTDDVIPCQLDEKGVKKELFSALEEENLWKLARVKESINSFNRKVLRRAITIDKSGPFLEKVICIDTINAGVNAYNQEAITPSIEADSVVNHNGKNNETDAQQSTGSSSSSFKAVPDATCSPQYHLEDEITCNHEEYGEYQEDSNTESADEMIAYSS